MATTEAKATHSAGPWIFEDIDERTRKDAELGDEAHFWICGGVVDEVLATVHAPVHGDSQEANARLMAAAPDLLVALDVIVADYQALIEAGLLVPVDDEANALTAAKAALKKAVGL